ncbi:hypothetical protein HDV00_008719 [Rhizophlyctis rosea]|nr:hypothetical protein HDV00_008719 [Rhizophlyctis rosea]
MKFGKEFLKMVSRPRTAGSVRRRGSVAPPNTPVWDFPSVSPGPATPVQSRPASRTSTPTPSFPRAPPNSPTTPTCGEVESYESFVRRESERRMAESVKKRAMVVPPNTPVWNSPSASPGPATPVQSRPVSRVTMPTPAVPRAPPNSPATITPFSGRSTPSFAVPRVPPNSPASPSPGRVSVPRPPPNTPVSVSPTPSEGQANGEDVEVVQRMGLDGFESGVIRVRNLKVGDMWRLQKGLRVRGAGAGGGRRRPGGTGGTGEGRVGGAEMAMPPPGVQCVIGM